jgi:hypothetical protein
VYPTQLPPPLTLHYAVTRGAAEAEARLTWRHADGRYEIELRSSLDAAPGRRRGAAAAPKPLAALTPHWTSRGVFDEAGVAPERFAVARRGRERHAANFRREEGIVSFSGPAQTWPLAAGAQDRLSWMVQLAAVLQADAALAAPGTRISMLVVGAHGDAEVWTFEVLGSDTLAGQSGETIAALRLRREARFAHDVHVEAWLAPALHHLPARLKLSRRGESTEFALRALQPP